MQAAGHLECVADASATGPSTWKLEDKASYQPLLHDKETSRTREYTLNSMNQALV